MKLIHSYVPNRFTTENMFSSTISKEMIYPQLLSVLLAKREHGSIDLYTNSVIKKQIEEIGIPYDQIDTEVLEDYSPELFCLPKLLVYMGMQEPYIHIDTDTLIFRKIETSDINSPVFYSHPDIRIPQYYDKAKLKDFYESFPSLSEDESFFHAASVTYLELFYKLGSDHSYFKIKNIRVSEIPNMNIIGVHDFKSFGEASKLAMDHYERNKEIIEKYRNPECYVEQLMVHLNMMEINQKYREDVRAKKNFLMEEAPLRADKTIPNDIRDTKFPITLYHTSHIPCESDLIRQDGFLYKRIQEVFGHNGRSTKINSEDEIYDLFNFDFYGLNHLTFYKHTDLFQAIVIGYIVDNFGEDYVRNVFNYFKRIKGHSYDLPRLSSGEILYKKLTGFTFDLNPGII